MCLARFSLYLNLSWTRSLSSVYSICSSTYIFFWPRNQRFCPWSVADRTSNKHLHEDDLDRGGRTSRSFNWPRLDSPENNYTNIFGHEQFSLSAQWKLIFFLLFQTIKQKHIEILSCTDTKPHTVITDLLLFK